MRTSLDIPDPVYRAMKVRAAVEGITIRELVLEAVAQRLGNAGAPASDAPRFPVIRSKRPGALKLGEEGVYEYIPFP